MVIVSFLINWLVLLVVSYVLMEYGQYFLYDEPVAYLWPRALGGSFLLALGLTIKPLSYLTMFGNDIGWTVGFGILWFLVFTLLYRFQPQHGAAIGVVALLIMAGMAEMATSSFQESVRPTVREKAPVFDPAKQGLRKSGGPAAAPAADASKSKAEAAQP